MTTVAPGDWINIATIRDVTALQLLNRYVTTELSVLEARVRQLQQLGEAINGRIESLENATEKKGK